MTNRLPTKFEVHLENVRRSTMELRDKVENIYVYSRQDTNIDSIEKQRSYDLVDKALVSQGEDFTIQAGSLMLYRM